MNGTQVTVVGNLTDDPELRFTPSGAAVAKFTVAVNRRTLDRQSNEWKDAGADFHRVTCWRGLAENVAESLQKGMRVLVVGDLRSSQWEDAKTSEKRYGWDLHAQAVGPDLTWATAKVAKTSRGGRTDAGDDVWAGASRQRPEAAPAAGQAPAGWGSSAPAGGGYSDEPPF